MSTLELKSEPQIIGQMARVILANSGLNDLSPGSVLLTLLQAAAQEDFSQYYAMLQIIRNYNLDTTTNTDLDNRASEYGLTRIKDVAATGRISILRDDTFVKISSTSYTGFRSRIAGDMQLFLNNAASFPTSGAQQTLIIGRGTVNEETVTYTPALSNPQNNTNYYTITLDVPLSNDHALEETVILKQGLDILVPAGTVVQVPAMGQAAQITFSTTVNATILAGELSVDDVDVKCNVLGTTGNIGVGTITGTTAFTSPPFSGARAYNANAYSNGYSRETDTKLRNRIKAHIQSISQSTQSGIANAINGLTDASTAKSVVSNNIILPSNVGLPVKIYIDDGTGFEPDFARQGAEMIVADAIGGELRVPLDLFPLVKAQLETLSTEPFDMSSGVLDLLVNVGSQSETLQFYTSMFAIPSAATSEEIVTAINGQATLIEARTAEVGSRVVIDAKADTNEDIQIMGGTANTSTRLNFPTNLVKTFYLYKNDQLLSKDGNTAFIDSGNQQPYSVFAVPRTLTLVVDGKTANPQTVNFVASNFSLPAAATAAEVAAVINAQVSGITAINANGSVRLISNTTLSDKSKIHVTGGTANGGLAFSTVEVVGSNQDYKLNPELGVVELVDALVAHDILTAGTRNTRAFLTAGSFDGNYSFGVSTNILRLYVDGSSVQSVTIPPASYNASSLAAVINPQLIGATAVVRTIGTGVSARSYLEIRTNTFTPGLAGGSIQIDSSIANTANTILNFVSGLVVYSIPAHTAYQTASTTGPYAFVEGNTLVVVIDNDPTGKTFIITMNYGGTITSSNTVTHFGAAGFSSVFLNDYDLPNFWCVMKSGSNTTTGAMGSVTALGSNVFQYNWQSPPASYAQFAVNDQATFSGMNNAGNNGNFLISTVVPLGTTLAAAESRSNSNPATLTPTIGQRFLVGPDANTTTLSSVLRKTIANPYALTPANGDAYIVAPAANNVRLADVQSAIIVDSTLATPTNGFRYVINGVGLNAWAGHNQQIAWYNGVGIPGWQFLTPADGDVVQSLGDSKYYQYSAGTSTWSENKWGGNAGKVATWNSGSSSWAFTVSSDLQVRTVTLPTPVVYQFIAANIVPGSLTAEPWVENDWGGQADKVAQWSGSAWNYTAPTLNATIHINDLGQVWQYNGTVWTVFTFWVRVTNPTGVAEVVTAAGTGFVGQRRQITAYIAGSGSITVGAGYSNPPIATDTFMVLPGTATNIVTFFRNTKVTSLSTKADIELALAGTRVQIVTLANGSDGYVQVTGGRANDLLQFSNTIVLGLQAYSYYTGLIKLVHSTIYGDEKDPVTFPGVGAAGIKFQILPPTVQEVGFTLDVALAAGISLSSVETDIKTQVIGYINGLGIFAPVVLSNVVQAVLKVSGITDVKITAPTTNIVVRENELARTKASIISINLL